MNNCDRQEIDNISFLTPFQKESLWDYLSKHRPLKSIYELQYIIGFNTQDAMQLAEICVIGTWEKPHLYHRQKHRLFLSTSTQIKTVEGIRDSSDLYYPQNRRIAKYRFTTEKINTGFNAENDAGEAKRDRSGNPLPDYLSCYSEFTENSYRILIGDYDLQMGQGLIAWNGYRPFKTSSLGSGLRKANQFKPHSSSEENLFCRGIAAQKNINIFSITGFGSQSKIDGSIEEGSIHYQKTGIHRTAYENGLKDRLTRTTGGLSIGFKSKNISSELYTVQHQTKDGTTDSTVYTSAYAIHTMNRIGNSIIYTESATDNYLHPAILIGCDLKPMSGIEMNTIFRYYSKDYSQPMANGFSNFSGTTNETGFFTGFNCYYWNQIQFNGFYDLYKNLSPRYRLDATSLSNDYAIFATFPFSRQLSISLGYRQDTKCHNKTGDESIVRQISTEKRNRYIIKLVHYMEKDQLQMGGSIANHASDEEQSDGWLLYMRWKNEALENIKFTVQAAEFNTTYSSRIYLYEPDIPFYFSVPAYSGTGLKTSTVIQYNNNSITVAGKYSFTKYKTLYKDTPEDIGKHSITIGLLVKIDQLKKGDNESNN